MYKQIILCILGVIASNAFCQTQIVGKVIQSDGSPVEYFSVRFLTDSTSLASGSFVGGHFSAVVPTGVNNVEVSAWGFDSKRRNINTTRDTLIISLVNHQHELGEVNIVANKKNLIVDGSSFTLAVEGTVMSELATINDVLCKVPLLMVNENDGISMFGKDNVVVYVNNRRIKDKRELENLSPKIVKNVKLICSPGAQYDADADAVVSVTTKDYNGTEVILRNIATKGRLFSDITNAILNMRHGTTNIHADYTFTASRNKSYEGSSIENNGNRQEYNNDEKTTAKLYGHSYSIAGDHTFNNENKLSLQFVGRNDRSEPEVNGIQEYGNSNSSSLVATSKKTKDHCSHYDVGADYDFTFGNQSGMSLSANYTIHRVETNNDIIEDFQLHNYGFDSKYYAIDSQIDYQTAWDNGVNVDAGTKISVVSNNSESVFDSKSTALESSFSYEYDFTERIIGSYINLGKITGVVDVNIGLRVEQTSFEGNHNKYTVVDTIYFTFAPNFKFTYTTAAKNKLSLTYRSTISRPSFNNLSPSIRYDNAFYYRRGNPSLLPTITDNITLACNIGSQFWINLGYRHKGNATIYQYTQTANNNAIEVIIGNHRHIHFMLASVGYNINKGRFRSSNSISITKPFAKIRIYQGEYKIDRCAYYFKTINDLTINKHLNVNVDFIFNDPGETLLEKKNAMYNLSVGATAFVLDRSLAISLTANDILDSYTFKDHREFGFFKVDHKYDPDNTYVRLTARYQFNSGKTKKVKPVNSNSLTVDRM